MGSIFNLADPAPTIFFNHTFNNTFTNQPNSLILLFYQWRKPSISQELFRKLRMPKKDPNLSYRAAGTMFGVTGQSIINHCSGKTKPAPDCFASYQKLSPIEECVLVEHCMQAYQADFPLTITSPMSFCEIREWTTLLALIGTMPSSSVIRKSDLNSLGLLIGGGWMQKIRIRSLNGSVASR